MSNATNDHLELSKKKAKENNQFLVPHIEHQYEKYFSKVSKLEAGDVIVVSRCRLCNHKLRKEAEALWEKTKGASLKGNYTMVMRYLNQNLEENENKFIFQGVSVHLDRHYEQQVRRMWLREYGDHLASIMNYKTTKDQMFETMIQALQLKLFEAAANPQIEVGRQADMMTKLTKSILDISLTQAKLRGEIEAVEIYKEKFQQVTQIIVNYISSEKDAERQQELIQELDTVREQIAEE